MTEIQTLFSMGAIVALMLCLISGLFYQSWPSQSWRTLVQFWLLVMSLCVLGLFLSGLQPTPAEVPISTQDPPPWHWLIGGAVTGFGYALSWYAEQRDRHQQQGQNSAGIPGGLPQAHSPYASDYGYADPPDITHAGAKTKRGSRRGYSIDGDRPPHPGHPGGIPQPPAPKAPSSDPPRRIMAVQWPLKPSAEAAGMAPGDLPPRPRFARAVAAPRLMARLDALTYNRELSERLIAQNLEKNPGRSPDWAADKAIWDIERDRQ